MRSTSAAPSKDSPTETVCDRFKRCVPATLLSAAARSSVPMVRSVDDAAAARASSQAGVTINVDLPSRSSTTALSPIGRTPEKT